MLLEANLQKLPPKQVIGMAYVPMQVWQNLIPMEQGFAQGTIFQELNKPFQPKRRG